MPPLCLPSHRWCLSLPLGVFTITSRYQISHPHAVVSCLHNWASVRNKMHYGTTIILADGLAHPCNSRTIALPGHAHVAATPLPPSAARSYIKPRSPTSASFIRSAQTPLLPRRTEDLIYSFHSFGLPHQGRRMKSACLVATQTHFSGAPAFRSDSGIEQSPVTR